MTTTQSCHQRVRQSSPRARIGDIVKHCGERGSTARVIGFATRDEEQDAVLVEQIRGRRSWYVQMLGGVWPWDRTELSQPGAKP